MVDLELSHHCVGVFARAVGEDQLPPGKFFQGGTERRIWLER
jgi:hypothetical protein